MDTREMSRVLLEKASQDVENLDPRLELTTVQQLVVAVHLDMRDARRRMKNGGQR